MNYRARLERIWDAMAKDGIAMTMFEDCEARRDTTIRWLTGQPGDALLFLSADRKSLLVPWDMIIAGKRATADEIVPYNDFDRIASKAIRAAAERFALPKGAKVELPSATPYPAFAAFASALEGFEPICREKGTADLTLSMRAVKDADEIAILRKATEITNEIIDMLIREAVAGRLNTEADAALLIELESRKRGCEGTGFETLSAGPARSFGIHAFPPWGAGPFATRGLSILDFGLCYEGYNTDITLTFARAPDPKQEEMLRLIEKAAAIAQGELLVGNRSAAVAAKIDEFFAGHGRRMAHGLGHGVGLDVHERPFLRNNPSADMELKSGMVVAVEPALYDPDLGGCRMENDFLITDSGPEMLTRSRVVRI